MNIFDELGKIYNEIDSDYAAKEIFARSKGYNRKEIEYQSKRQFNDQAYFLYMFTRLEGRIRDLSDTLIDSNVVATVNWKTKRSWEIINKQNLNLMNRVALLTQKGHADYNLIKRYYDQRNNIGHGNTFTIVISIPTVITDMKRLYRDLNR